MNDKQEKKEKLRQDDKHLAKQMMDRTRQEIAKDEENRRL